MAVLSISFPLFSSPPLFWFLPTSVTFFSLSKSRTKPLFLWRFLPLPPYLFLLPPTQFSREMTKSARWTVPLLSGECQTCSGKRSSAFEILFRTDCCFCKSLCMVKILVCSFGGKEKKKKITSEKWKATQTGEKTPNDNFQWEGVGEWLLMVCCSLYSSLPFS